jgi:hypothetical protein
LTYPGLKKVAEIPYFHGNITASDPNNGDVIIDVGEYTHGGTKPFAYLTLLSGESPHGVTFDSTTDYIAYSVDKDSSDSGWIGVYRNLNDPPTVYTDPNMSYYGSVVYDGQGNLIVLGKTSAGQQLFAELPKGASQFTDLASNHQLNAASDLLWDGQYVVVRKKTTLLRVTVSGSTLKIVGKTRLKDAYGAASDKFWIAGTYAVASRAGSARRGGRYVALWHYPQGGAPLAWAKWVSKNPKERFEGATVSVEPSR